MIENTRRQARLLRNVGVLLSPAIIFFFIYWNKVDESGLSKAWAWIIWLIPSIVSILCITFSIGRFEAAKRMEKKENLKLLADSNLPEAANAKNELALHEKSDSIAGWLGISMLIFLSLYIIYYIVIVPIRSNYPSGKIIFGAIISLLLLTLIGLIIKRLTNPSDKSDS